MPKFSICVPVYNRQKYISTALASVYEQSCDDYEIIAVDDGSSDGTYEMLLQHQQQNKKLKVLRHPSNRGAAAARNTAWREAKGEFILWLDSDDLLDASLLSCYEQAIEEYPEVSVFYTQHIAYHESSKKEMILDYGDWYKNKNELVATVFRKNPLPFGGVITKKTVVEEVKGFDESFLCSIDYDFWVRVIMTTSVEFKLISEPLYVYRFHDQNLAGLKLSDTQCAMNVRILKRILECYKLEDLFPEFAWTDNKLQAQKKSYLEIAKRFEARRAFDIATEYKEKAEKL